MTVIKIESFEDLAHAMPKYEGVTVRLSDAGAKGFNVIMHPDLHMPGIHAMVFRRANSNKELHNLVRAWFGTMYASGNINKNGEVSSGLGVTVTGIKTESLANELFDFLCAYVRLLLSNLPVDDGSAHAIRTRLNLFDSEEDQP